MIDESGRSARHFKFALAGVFLLGLFLRIFELEHESLWIDEAGSILTARQPLVQMLSNLATDDTHPPGYYALLNGWIRLFGDGEFSTRLLSALFGFGSIPLIFALGAVLFDRRTGLAAALLLSLSALGIYYSQEVRMYSMLVFFSLASYFSLWNLLNTGQNKWWWSYLLAIFILAMTHNTTIFILVSQQVIFLSDGNLRQALDMRAWFKLQLFALLPFFLLIPLILSQISASREVGYIGWIQSPTLGHVAELFTEFGGAFPDHSHAELSLWYQAASGTLGFIMVFVLVRVGVKKLMFFLPGFQGDEMEVNRTQYTFLFFGSILPIIIPFVVSHFFMPVFLVRVCLPALCPLILLVSRQIIVVRSPIIRVFLAGLCLVSGCISCWQYFQNNGKIDWRAAALSLTLKCEKGETVYLVPPYSKGVLNYYFKRSDVRVSPFPVGHDSISNLKTEISRELGGRKRFWWVCSHLREEFKEFPKLMERFFRLEEAQDFSGVKVFRFGL